jgi:hypothetical protein
MDPKELRWEGMSLIHLAQERDDGNAAVTR